MEKKLDFVFFGLTITTSWGSDHITSLRGLIKELHKNGHNIQFFERDSALYATNRDLPNPDYCKVTLYNSVENMKIKYQTQIKNADVVIVGSDVPEGWEIGKWVIRTAKGIKIFYDFDSHITMERFQTKNYINITPQLLPQYDLYLSFTGGALLKQIEMVYSSPMARPLYCSVDPEIHNHKEMPAQWDLGFLGTYSVARQPLLEKSIFSTAKEWSDGKFVVAGPNYPDFIKWPDNIQQLNYITPSQHSDFYNSQRYTLNISRGSETSKAYSPRCRVFEAAGCGTPIITDYWEGLETFFIPGKDLLIADTSEDILFYLKNLSEEERLKIGNNGRLRALKSHTAKHRANEFEGYIMELQNVSASYGNRSSDIPSNKDKF